MVKDYFKYNNGEGIVPTGAFRISPSQASLFFDKTSEWWRSHLLKEDPSFMGSSFSELGNCVHTAAEMYVDTGRYTSEDIDAYINSLDNTYDKDFIKLQYPAMADALISQFLQFNIPSHTEHFLWKEVLPNIGVGGSIDHIDVKNKVLRDYKTTNSLTPPDKFSRNYYFQQMLYWWLCKQNGIHITQLELIFITTNQVGRISDKTMKPLKDYPSNVTVVTHVVTEHDMNLIESIIDLIANSVQLWNTTPSIRWALAQDWRLHSQFKEPHKFFNLDK